MDDASWRKQDAQKVREKRLLQIAKRLRGPVGQIGALMYGQWVPNNGWTGDSAMVGPLFRYGGPPICHTSAMVESISADGFGVQPK